MQPQLANKIEKATRKQFPGGIPGYGTDALRYTFYSLTSTDGVSNADLRHWRSMRRSCNESGNACRYVLSHTEGHELYPGERHAGLADRWIQTGSRKFALSEVEAAYDSYDSTSSGRYDFVRQMNSQAEGLGYAAPLWTKRSTTAEQTGRPQNACRGARQIIADASSVFIAF